jgi:branched-chain amino acid aminotransferase
MTKYAIKNGEIHEESSLKTSYFSRSVKYGDGFFETIYLFNGKILYWHLHAERLAKTAKLLHFNLPQDWDANYFSEMILKLAKSNDISSGRVTIVFTRDVEGYYLPTGNGFHYVIQVSKMNKKDKPYELNSEGLKLGEYRELIKNSNYTSTLKCNNAMIYVMASLFASKQGFDETLIFNENGRVSECISSNIILLKNGSLVTPPFNEYAIDGIMKKVVLQKAEAYGYKVDQYPIHSEDLFSAQEVWLTNVIKGLQWVKEYRGKVFEDNSAKQMVSLINKL